MFILSVSLIEKIYFGGLQILQMPKGARNKVVSKKKKERKKTQNRMYCPELTEQQQPEQKHSRAHHSSSVTKQLKVS